ncbi:MAG TPA: ABC transporter permease [Ktedonobacteraceae bacterium]|nr:ABC transporter permease [Ktedonobacteraceae bacterium]
MPQAPTQGDVNLPSRTSSVILGRQDYLSVLLRLTGMELYKVRRRVMSKVLGMMAIAIVILIFLLISLGTFVVLNAPPEDFTVPCRGSRPASCQQPSAAQSAQARFRALQTASEPLRLPNSLGIIEQLAIPPGAFLLITLVGSMVGGEFSVGTVRLMFTRGPTRTQFLFAKLGATTVCIVIGVLAMFITGVLASQLFNVASGIGQDLNFFTASWLVHTILFVLVAMLNWLMYAAIAIFFGTLGRSIVAGIVGALSWFFAEAIVQGVLSLAGFFNRGPFGDFLKAIPDYLIANNIGALAQNQGQYILGGGGSSLSDLHALIVLAVYFSAFIGLAWWVNKRRDVTN